MLFYVGLHQPSDAKHFDRACIAQQRLRPRKANIGACKVLLDSGAFTELNLHGKYRTTPQEYCDEIGRLHRDGVVNIEIAVTQDYMCEPFMLKKTGMTVTDHHRLTIERYDALLACNPPVPVMPVLQGFRPSEYANHMMMYGDRLRPGMWVGVGSVCKRNGDPEQVLAILRVLHGINPALRYHGFGLKTTALAVPEIWEKLYSADSLGWSYAARKQGRSANDWREAAGFRDRIEGMHARSI